MKQSTPVQSTTPRYSSLQVSTTPRGRVVPLVYGTHKVTSDMIWAQDFHFVTYTPQNSNSSGKGGGGSGGKGATGRSEYYYFSAFLSALCEGPIYSFVAARDGSMWVYFNAGAPVTAWPMWLDPMYRLA